MKISLNVTDNGPRIAHPSACLKKLLFIVNITSVANFNNKHLKMSNLTVLKTTLQKRIYNKRHTILLSRY